MYLRVFQGIVLEPILLLPFIIDIVNFIDIFVFLIRRWRAMVSRANFINSQTHSNTHL